MDTLGYTGVTYIYIHTLHCIALNCITLHYITFITLHCITLQNYITLHYIHYITLHYITLHSLHYIALHYITFITLHCITLHYIAYIYIYRYTHANIICIYIICVTIKYDCGSGYLSMLNLAQKLMVIDGKITISNQWMEWGTQFLRQIQWDVEKKQSRKTVSLMTQGP